MDPDDVFDITSKAIERAKGAPPVRPPVAPPPSGGDDGGMEKRIEALEKDVATIKTDVAVIKATMATKEDVAKVDARVADARASIILWVVTVGIIGQLLPALPGFLKAMGWIK